MPGNTSSLTRLVGGELRPLIDPREPWAIRAETDMVASGKTPGWRDLAIHVLDEARAKPTKKWLADAQAIIASIGVLEFTSRLGDWLLLVAEPPVDPRLSDRLFEGDNGTLLRGLVWASSSVAGAPVAAIGVAASACLVKNGGRGARSLKVANGCIWSLATIGSDDAIGELTRISWTTEYSKPAELISRHLNAIAENRGVRRSELELLSVHSPRGSAASLEAALIRASNALEKSSWTWPLVNCSSPGGWRR